MKSGGEDLMTAAEVAAELRCSKAQVHRIIRGQVEHVSALPVLRLGRKRVVRRSSFERWKADNERCARGAMLASSPEVDAS